MSFSSKPKALATLGVYRKLVHILEVYHKKEVVINCEKQIKKGVLMINTSRGEIIDTNALIEGIENVIKNRDLLILKAHPNVIVTPHAAFYTILIGFVIQLLIELIKKKKINNIKTTYANSHKVCR